LKHINWKNHNWHLLYAQKIEDDKYHPHEDTTAISTIMTEEIPTKCKSQPNSAKGPSKGSSVRQTFQQHCPNCNHCFQLAIEQPVSSSKMQDDDFSNDVPVSNKRKQSNQSSPARKRSTNKLVKQVK